MVHNSTSEVVSSTCYKGSKNKRTVKCSSFVQTKNFRSEIETLGIKISKRNHFLRNSVIVSPWTHMRDAWLLLKHDNQWLCISLHVNNICKQNIICICFTTGRLL